MRKHYLDLLEGGPYSLGEAEREVNRSCEVESSEHKVRSPCDRSAGGTVQARAKLSSQLVAVARETALVRTFTGIFRWGMSTRQGL
ncbi:hypothetical protein PAXRUDRAFT_555719 [Paxillus rubicundulus Ve08.2h10]|uniref:Uncharacterized protein n=1 Tax=Paxillus rubicundulus Ve08.2h10 TaxID=930991 RepID=A0A0D0DZT0_9AGAM|nr:hypothetical protein PAXRUDRAFT_555719 [Paxillus rubicundulus Ve08.2h10]